MPKADATELAPKKSAYRKPSGTLHPSGRVSGFCPRAPQRFLKSAHFFGEAPEPRPWAIKREDRRLLLPGAPNPAFLVPLAVGIPPSPIQASILSHSTSSNDSFSAPRRRESE